MRPVRKGMLFLDLLTIPATLIKALHSKSINLNQLQKNIEVQSDIIVERFQVSQVCKHSIERCDSY
jgi:non-homologous end joining protein Ku